MTKTMQEALDYAKELIAADLEEALQRQATKALGAHQVKWKTAQTGNLIGDIRSRITDEGIEISFPYYAKYLEWGTGLHGPQRRRIYPKHGKVLAWKSGGKLHFARSVEGMHPAPFIRPVFHQQFIPIVTKALAEAFKDEVELR
jgi:HK97 gp10 family phage protein